MGKAYEETKFILDKYSIHPNKRLGQNFLIDDETINNIIFASDINEDELIIEIGPGIGVLTSRLLDIAKRVVAIELDSNMVEILNERFKLYENFELINKDILKVDLEELIEKEKRENNIKGVKIVANLPYYITTPIIMKLLKLRLNIDSIVVMIQKEVADRITAEPGSKLSGSITYAVNYYSETENIFNVSQRCFIPNPKVESEVIKLIIREKPLVEVKDEELFFKIIRVSFEQRRKTLVNGISNSGITSKEKITEILKELEFDERTRGENLTIDQFAQIANKLKENNI